MSISYRWLRWFHGPAEAVLVPTRAIHQRLAARGFTNLAYWSRGVDLSLFAPAERESRAHERPIFLYAGRVAIEKSLEDFLSTRPARHEVGRRRRAGARRAARRAFRERSSTA